DSMGRIGGQSEVAPIRRVLLKRPLDAFVDERRIEAEWRDLRFTARPDLRRAQAEHERFAQLLAAEGAEILYLPGDQTTGLDSIYVRDAVVVSDRGAVLCQMGKVQRRGEPAAAGRHLDAAGLPIAGRIEGSGRLEGGDVVFLDSRTVAVGQGY